MVWKKDTDIHVNIWRNIFTCAFVASKHNTVCVKVSPVVSESLFFSNKCTNRAGKSGTSRYPPAPVVPTKAWCRVSQRIQPLCARTPSIISTTCPSAQRGPFRCLTLAELDLEAEAVAGFALGRLACAGAVPFGTLWVGWGEKEDRSRGAFTAWATGESLVKGYWRLCS